MSSADIARRCAATMFANDKASKSLGIGVNVNQAGQAEAVFEVTENMLNGHDVCHGGFIFALADTAFAFACNGYDQMTLAAGASIDFLLPAKAGDTLTAVAKEAHRGGRNGLYDVIVSNQDKAQVALFRGRSYATSQPILDKPDT